jgi:hypothetical protein
MYNNGNSSKNVTGASVVDGTMESADFPDNGLSADKIDGGTLSNVNVDDTTAANIIAQVDDNEISGDKIDAGVISNFQSTGIDDRLASGKVLYTNGTSVGVGVAAPTQKLEVTSSGSGYVTEISNTMSNSAGNGLYVQTRYNSSTNIIAEFTSNTGSSKVLTVWGGGGISFNGDTAAGNKLDDYEEGKHTVTLTPITSGTITTWPGLGDISYTVVGRIVHIGGEINIMTATSPVGTLLTMTLPFPTADDSYASRIGGSATLHLNATGHAQSNLPFRLSTNSSNLNMAVDCSTLVSNDIISFSFSYRKA